MKLKHEPKVCKKCGAKFIQTGKGNQVYCPDCQAGRKPNTAYIKARQPGEVRIIIPKQAGAGSGGNGCKETIETPEKTLQQVETPEPDAWYKARITKGDAVMLEAKIHPEMLALILKEVR
ncbi:MAG: hypothetical protein IIZ86_06640 [Firmicutes bacterium]|nr:hypothetical protein [Bacillota bacterium]